MPCPSSIPPRTCILLRLQARILLRRQVLGALQDVQPCAARAGTGRQRRSCVCMRVFLFFGVETKAIESWSDTQTKRDPSKTTATAPGAEAEHLSNAEAEITPAVPRTQGCSGHRARSSTNVIVASFNSLPQITQYKAWGVPALDMPNSSIPPLLPFCLSSLPSSLSQQLTLVAWLLC